MECWRCGRSESRDIGAELWIGVTELRNHGMSERMGSESLGFNLCVAPSLQEPDGSNFGASERKVGADEREVGRAYDQDHERGGD